MGSFLRVTNTTVTLGQEAASHTGGWLYDLCTFWDFSRLGFLESGLCTLPAPMLVAHLCLTCNTAFSTAFHQTVVAIWAHAHFQAVFANPVCDTACWSNMHDSNCKTILNGHLCSSFSSKGWTVTWQRMTVFCKLQAYCPLHVLCIMYLLWIPEPFAGHAR